MKRSCATCKHAEWPLNKAGSRMTHSCHGRCRFPLPDTSRFPDGMFLSWGCNAINPAKPRILDVHRDHGVRCKVWEKNPPRGKTKG